MAPDDNARPAAAGGGGAAGPHRVRVGHLPRRRPRPRPRLSRPGARRCRTRTPRARSRHWGIPAACRAVEPAGAGRPAGRPAGLGRFRGRNAAVLSRGRRGCGPRAGRRRAAPAASHSRASAAARTRTSPSPPLPATLGRPTWARPAQRRSWPGLKYTRPSPPYVCAWRRAKVGETRGSGGPAGWRLDSTSPLPPLLVDKPAPPAACRRPDPPKRRRPHPSPSPVCVPAIAAPSAAFLLP
jgi:hypothetical protein